MVISDRLGRTSYKEQYAFFFRNESGIRLVDSYHYDDGDEAQGDDIFMREPFVTHFRFDKAVTKDIVLIPLHASPDFAVEEISALVDVHDDAVKKWGINNVMVLGDLNADCSYVTASEWMKIELRTDSRYQWEISDNTDTTVSGTDCAYDRIVVSGDSLKTSVLSGTATAYRFEEDFELSYEEALAVSDHYPVEIELELA